MKHLYLTIIGYSLWYIQQTSDRILLLCRQYKEPISWSSALFLTACKHMFRSTKRCGYLLQLSCLVQSTVSTLIQVIWNISENTENGKFFKSLHLFLYKINQEWVWGWNFSQDFEIYVKNIISHALRPVPTLNTPLLSVLSTVLVWIVSLCCSLLTLKFPLWL